MILQPRRFTVKAMDKKKGMSAAEIRRALVGVPTEVTPRILTTWSGRIKEITVEFVRELPDLPA